MESFVKAWRQPNLIHLFWFALIIHCIAWATIPQLAVSTAPLDTVEKIALGLQNQFGYSNHPPLAHWLSSLLFRMIGSPRWTAAILSQSSLFICFAFIWRFARQFLSAQSAICALFCLEGVYYFTIASTQFNENILSLPLWSGCAYFFFDAITTKSIKSWLLAGALLGLACITKYEVMILIMTLFAFISFYKPARTVWSQPGFYLGCITCLMIFLPNLIWLLQHHFLPFNYALNKAKMSIDSNHNAHAAWPLFRLLQDITYQLAAILPAFLLLLPFYLKRTKTTGPKPFHEVYLGYLAFGPLLCSVAIGLIFGARIYPLWGIPFFIWIGVYWMVKWQPSYSQHTFRNFIIAASILGSVMVLGRTLDLEFGPAWNGHAGYQNYPAQRLANSAEQLWQAYQGSHLPAVIATQHEAQSVVAYSSLPHPVPYISWEGVKNTWVNEAQIRKSGAIVIYPVASFNDREFPGEMRTHFPTLGPAFYVEIPYETHYNVPPLRVVMAVLPPLSGQPRSV